MWSFKVLTHLRLLIENCAYFVVTLSVLLNLEFCFDNLEFSCSTSSLLFLLMVKGAVLASVARFHPLFYLMTLHKQ